MQLTSDLLQQLVAQARRDWPNETCGILAGAGSRALKVFPLRNVDANPRVTYNADPLELLRAFQEIEARGWEHLAIYHSHPATPPAPSPTDIERAFYPEVVYLIISLMDPAQVLVRAFRIIDTKVEEISLEIEDSHESPRSRTRRVARRTNRPRAGRAMETFSDR